MPKEYFAISETELGVWSNIVSTKMELEIDFFSFTFALICNLIRGALLFSIYLLISEI